METQSLGKLVPQVLIPYAQQWAQRSGMTLLSRLLEDEQFRGLIEKYSDEIAALAASAVAQSGNGAPKRNGSSPRSWESNGNGSDASKHLMRLQERLSALEVQHDLQQAIFEQLRAKVRPLALALGCCPECFVGMQGCQKCGGRSSVGTHEPDLALLNALIVKPLVERGVPMRVGERKSSATSSQSKETIANAKEKKTWPKK